MERHPGQSRIPDHRIANLTETHRVSPAVPRSRPPRRIIHDRNVIDPCIIYCSSSRRKRNLVGSTHPHPATGHTAPVIRARMCCSWRRSRPKKTRRRSSGGEIIGQYGRTVNPGTAVKWVSRETIASFCRSAMAAISSSNDETLFRLCLSSAAISA